VTLKSTRSGTSSRVRRRAPKYSLPSVVVAAATQLDQVDTRLAAQSARVRMVELDETALVAPMAARVASQSACTDASPRRPSRERRPSIQICGALRLASGEVAAETCAASKEWSRP